MKKIVLAIQVLISLITLASCTQSEPKRFNDSIDNNATIEKSGEEAFRSFTEFFSESASYAYATVSDRKVLLVSHETFGNNMNSDLEAVAASVFALDSNGKIVSLGSVRSQGTLYPVSLLNGKLMVAGHRFVYIYSIRGDMPELVLDEYEEGESPELTSMFETFEKGEAIKFERSK